MLNRVTQAILGLIATTLFCVFIIGLANSISTGFAGFWGGLPFWIIAITVLLMAIYDFWDECLRKK